MRGDRLKQTREQRGITQEEMADALSVAYQQIWRWESGKNDPSAEMVSKMSKMLSVTSDYLLGLSDDPTRDLAEEDLSPMERKLIDAVRNGLIVEALEAITTLSKGANKSIIPPSQPAIHG